LYDLTVWNTQGVLLHQLNGLRNKSKLDLRALPNGIYWIQVVQGNRSWNGRLIIIP
jgi:hypothetical protein